MSNENFDWNATIENDSAEWTILEPGIYPFRVVDLEKSYSKAGNPMAILTLQVGAADTQLKDYLVLSRTAEWKLCAFFRALGLKKHGEPFAMDWDKVPGKKGKCEIMVSTFTKQDGSQAKNNKVKQYLDPDKKATKSVPEVDAEEEDLI